MWNLGEIRLRQVGNLGWGPSLIVGVHLEGSQFVMGLIFALIRWWPNCDWVKSVMLAHLEASNSRR